MKQAGYCTYPPQIAPDVEITPQSEGAKLTFVAGSTETGRYLILGVAEHCVMELLDGTASSSDVCRAMRIRHGAALPPATLTRFLTKLDEVGILAGERADRTSPALFPGLYLCWRLFNPDALFGRVMPAVRWIWSPGFFAASSFLILWSAVLALLNRAEVSGYATQTLQDHYLAILLVAWLVGMSHEFAHGMTSKAFGGRATEIGVLMIYYLLPALYCNVSGLHVIPQRSRRLWVIAVGIYWQLLVASLAMLAWLAFVPHTLLSDMAMVLLLSSVLDVAFNANPLIKLDGYYFLSQWLRIPNLMDRSRAYWRGLLLQVVRGTNTGGVHFTARERRILFIFGMLSFTYSLTLPALIVWYAAGYLMDWLNFSGLLLSLLLGLVYVRKPITSAMASVAAMARGSEEHMITNVRANLIPWAVAGVAVIALCFPWTASVGSYGTLIARPGQEAIIRAPESASLILAGVRPGQQVTRGMTIGRMANLDLEEQIVQMRTELARVNASAERLRGELGVQQESSAGVEAQVAQRRREFNDVKGEEEQIRVRGHLEAGIMLASTAQLMPAATDLPAALAVLQADVEMRRITVAEANQRRERARSLFNQSLLARSEFEAAEANSSAVASGLAASRERLNAALIDHHRRLGSVQTELQVAQSTLSTGRAQASNLRLQLEATRQLTRSLQERLALLQHKRSQFALVAPLDGTLFGEELPRMTGQYFPKGAEICRVANTRELLVRVQVAEQELGDIAAGQKVRIKARAFPNRVFHGVVSKIGGESELDQNKQVTYRAELTIPNEDGLLRPGMTVFARVDFGQRMVIWVLAHKLKQALRPELWML